MAPSGKLRAWCLLAWPLHARVREQPGVELQHLGDPFASSERLQDARALWCFPARAWCPAGLGWSAENQPCAACHLGPYPFEEMNEKLKGVAHALAGLLWPRELG